MACSAGSRYLPSQDALHCMIWCGEHLIFRQQLWLTFLKLPCKLHQNIFLHDLNFFYKITVNNAGKTKIMIAFFNNFFFNEYKICLFTSVSCRLGLSDPMLNCFISKVVNIDE